MNILLIIIVLFGVFSFIFFLLVKGHVKRVRASIKRIFGPIQAQVLKNHQLQVIEGIYFFSMVGILIFMYLSFLIFI